MNEDELKNISIDLRRKLMCEFRNTLYIHSNLDEKQKFHLITATFASIIGEVSYLIFKKDSIDQVNRYIDDVHNIAKELFKNFIDTKNSH